MGNCLPVARWRAILSLQQQRDRLDPNSFGFKIADHAITLLLNPSRPTSDFLVQNARRDAQSVLTRQLRRARARGMLSVLSTDDTLEIDPNVQRAKLLPNPETPEERFAAVQACEILREGVLLRGPLHRGIFDGWLQGDTLKETAIELGISPDYVKKLRGEIRKLAFEIIPTQRAA